MAQTQIEWTWRRVRRDTLSISQLQYALDIDAVVSGDLITLPGFTFNPWIGCTKVSPGCLHCYAAELDLRRFSKTLGGATKETPIVHWGKGAPRYRTSSSNWLKPRKWNRDAQYLGVRLRVFSSSLADWLDCEAPIDWLADFLALVASCPWLDWILVTKRPENWRARMAQVRDGADLNPAGRAFAAAWLAGGIWKNVWIVVSTEDQKRAEERVPIALDIPAIVHGASAEPLLGPINFRRLDVGDGNMLDALQGVYHVDGRGARDRMQSKLNWVIVGGESGNDVASPDGKLISTIRGMHPQWARSLRDQSHSSGAAYFHKQNGEWQQVFMAQASHWLWLDGKMEPLQVNADLALNAGAVPVWRVGTTNSGKRLDGREHVETPKEAEAA